VLSWFVQQASRRRSRAARRARNAALPAAYTEIAKKIQMVGGILGLSVIGILFLMVWKPGQ
jgi:uncharacterized membrane protein